MKHSRTALEHHGLATSNGNLRATLEGLTHLNLPLGLIPLRHHISTTRGYDFA